MIHSKNKIRVLVCGTNFGRVYLRGIEKVNDLFELAGILSHGSEQSKREAEKYNVPVFTDVAEIRGEDFDIACVVIRSTAVGGKGTEIAEQLLKKGIHVIQEHPVHYLDIVHLLRVARENKCVYHVNSFYPNIKSVRTFIELCNKLLEKSKVTYIDANCSIQVLFPMISILGQALKGFHPWDLQILKKDDIEYPFEVLAGNIKGIPALMKIQNQLDPKDPDNNGFLLHKISVGTTAGSLTLDSSNGYVIWNPQMYVPHADGVLDLYGDNNYIKLPVSEIAYESDLNTCYRDIYEELWTDGIVRELHEFLDVINNAKKRSIMMQHILTVGELWKEISDSIGSPELLEAEKCYGLSLKDLKA